MSEVRPITLNDLDTLIDMMVLMRAESPVLSKSVELNHKRTFDNLKNLWLGQLLIGVMSDDGCMIGIVGSNWYNARSEAYEQMLYVKPEKRGTSLAARLVFAFGEAAHRAGAKAVHVGSSTGISDERTARLYEKLGYSRSGISLSKEFNV